MKQIIKNVIKRLITKKLHLRLMAYNSLISNPNSYLYSTGWIQSLGVRKPIDKDGSPIPWMNFAVVKLLEDRLTDNLNIFEFGSGYSTYFYARKVLAVTSVEYDEDWFQLIKSDLPENVNLIYKAKDVDGDYCRIIGTANEQYDVVIVDGRDRVNCVKQSISALSAKGIILLDDSQRERYKEGIEFAIGLGFRALDIEGLKATDVIMNRSTILYRNDNCLGI